MYLNFHFRKCILVFCWKFHNFICIFFLSLIFIWRSYWIFIHRRCSPALMSCRSCLPINSCKRYGGKPSSGHGRNTVICSRLNIVPASRSVAAQIARRCMTTVSFSLSSTCLIPQPNAFSNSRSQNNQKKWTIEKFLDYGIWTAKWSDEEAVSYYE